MSLQIWLPLNGDLTQQGLSNVTVTNNGATVDNNGKIGKCYTLNGSSNYINISNLPNPKNISVAFWMKRNATTNSRQFMFTAWGGVTCEMTTTNYIHCYTNGGGGACDSTTAVTDDTGWVHVVYTFQDKVGGKLYLNGSLVTSAASNASISWTTTSGNIGNYSNMYYNGKMNDFRFYDHVLTTKEVKALSQGLVCHYPLNGNGRSADNIISGTQRADYSTSITYPSDGKLCTGSGGNGTFSITTDSTCPVGKYSYNVLNNTSGNRDFQQHNIPYVAGKKYTGSWWAKGSGTCLYRVWNQTKQSQPMSQTFTLTSDWKYYTHTFTATQEMEDDNCTFHLGVTGASSIYMCGMKLEQNDHATPWMPSIYDSAYTSMGYNSTTEYDVSGYKYNGVKNGTFAYDVDTARYTVSTKFNGTNTYIEADPLPAETKTISVWLKTTWAYPPSDYRLAVHDKNTGLAIGWTGNSQQLITKVGTTNGSAGSTTGKYIANQWNHVVVVKTGDNTRDVYINGEPIITSISNYWGGDLNKLNIGTRHYNGSYSAYWDGQMSDFRAYATALSADDIKELYDTVASVSNTGVLLTRGEIVEQ